MVVPVHINLYDSATYFYITDYYFTYNIMKLNTKILPLVALLPCSVMSPHTQAGGFQLAEYSATGLGRAYSGEAAIADNASSQWRNPALLTYLEGTQVSMGAVYVDPNVDISGSGNEGTSTYTNTSSSDYIDGALIPNIYASYQIDELWTLGFAAGTNYGLKSELSSEFEGSILGDKGELITKEYVVSTGYKATDNIRIGVGVRYITAEGHFGSSVGTNGLAGYGLSQGTTYKYVEGDTTDWGWQAGMTWQIDEKSRLGIAYKSEVDLTLDGDYTSGVTTIDAELDLTLPATAEIAYYYQVDKDLMLSSSINWTDWSTFQSLDASTSAGTQELGEQNWRDNYRFGLGAEYQLNPQWKLRSGLAYDRSAVSDANRKAVIPEVDRYWITLGAGYQVSKQLTIDAGFAYILSEDGAVNDSSGSLANLNATTEGYILATGLQVSYAF